MIQNNRIVVTDGTTPVDRSVELSDYKAQTVTLPTTAGITIFRGLDWPFNHMWVEVDTANANAADIQVDIWDGTEWDSAVDILDQTALGGVTLAQSGVISWATDRNEGWSREDTSEDVLGLETFKIYKKYWIRVTVSAALSAGTIIKFVGQKFSDDSDLAVKYPELLRSEILTNWDPNNGAKANWDDQHFAAAEDIIRAMKMKEIIISEAQILEWDDAFKEASVHKTAMIILQNMGKDYIPDFEAASKAYKAATSALNQYNVDRDMDGRQDVVERRPLNFVIRR